MKTPDEQERHEELQRVLAAAREHQRFQEAREHRHEEVRRSHRATALAGGGERECARRRRQRAAPGDKWLRSAVGRLLAKEVPQ